MKKLLTILLLGLSLGAFAQQRITVKGSVAEANGQPMPGVTVMEKGSRSNGKVTDANGAFTISVPVGSTISASFIGYQTYEAKITNSNPLKIVLHEEAQVLEDVVVMGYGVQKKKLVTGATVQVKGDDIAKLNTVDVVGALQSQSPGVNIVQNNGFLGAGYKVTIRGLGTTGSSSPLYVIDGIAGGNIDALNPADIESVDILKDAASAAIYGARAANGVVLVTTKRGKAGKYQLTYDGYVGWQNLYKIPTVLSAKEYMAIQDEGRIMDGLTPYKWSTFIPARDLNAINDGTWKGTNWLKEILNDNALQQNHSVNVSGGNERSTFSLGFSYTKQEATMGVPSAVPELNKYNFRVNSEHVVLKNKSNDLPLLKIGETLNYSYSQTNGSFGTGGIYWNGLHNVLVMSPLMHAWNSTGDYYVYADQVADGYNWDTSNGANKNPIAYLDYYMNQNKNKSYQLQASAFAELQPIKDLKIRSQFSYRMASSSYRSFIPTHELTQTLSVEKDQVTQSEGSNHRWMWDITANYLFNIGEHHHLDAMAGFSVEKWGIGESMSGTNVGTKFDDFMHAYLSNAKEALKSGTASLSGSPSSPGSLASIFGRVNYNYDEKYMASVVMRYDGSSTFARGHRWGVFPSVSAGWVISREQFMEDVDWIDFLKLRASWGQNGNCFVGAFQYMATIASNSGYGGYPFGTDMSTTSVGSYAYKLINKDLTWETSEQIDIGFDARFLNNRLGVEFDWYNKKTIDWLVEAPILYSYGANAPSVNGGDVKNTGVELAFHWKDKIANEVNYGVNLTLATNKNKITKIANKDGIIHGVGSIPWEGAEECFRAEVGKPMGYFYGYQSSGIFQNQAQIDNYTGAKLNGAKTQPGDVIWVDKNNDGAIDANDRTQIGNPHPKWTLGLSFNFDWKGFDLNVTTYGAFGHQIFKCYRDFSSSPLNNYTADIYKRWTGEGSTNKYPRLTSASSTNWNRISDLYIEDGDYLKIKNITLGYDFKTAFPKLPVEQLRLYVSVQNLYTFTGYSGMDPEIGYGADYGWASGIDLGFYPSARTWMVGVNIKF